MKGRLLAALGVQILGQLSGRARAVDVEAEERRAAAPTARTTDFSMAGHDYTHDKYTAVTAVSPRLLLRMGDYRKHVWKDTPTYSNYDP